MSNALVNFTKHSYFPKWTHATAPFAVIRPCDKQTFRIFDIDAEGYVHECADTPHFRSAQTAAAWVERQIKKA